MLQFNNHALSIHPQSGYLPVWNAVYLNYSNPDESSRVYVSYVILAITWIRAVTTVSNTGETFPLQFLSVLLSSKNASWIISLWSEATLSYNWRCNQWRDSKLWGVASSSRNECNYLKFCDFSQPVGIFTRTFFLDKLLLLNRIDICPHQTWNKPVWNGILNIWVWNQNNRHVRITH